MNDELNILDPHKILGTQNVALDLVVNNGLRSEYLASRVKRDVELFYPYIQAAFIAGRNEAIFPFMSNLTQRLMNGEIKENLQISTPILEPRSETLEKLDYSPYEVELVHKLLDSIYRQGVIAGTSLAEMATPNVFDDYLRCGLINNEDYINLQIGALNIVMGKSVELASNFGQSEGTSLGLKLSPVHDYFLMVPNPIKVDGHLQDVQLVQTDDTAILPSAYMRDGKFIIFQ